MVCFASDNDWNRAEIVVGVNDARGVLADGSLAIAGKALTLTPAAICPDITIGDSNRAIRLILLGAWLEIQCCRVVSFL